MREEHAFLSVGFRPFYLGASLVAVLAMAGWLLYLMGIDILPGSDGGSRYSLSGSDWHAHEMVFGVVVAVISGFLLTAVRHWTELETARGLPLLLLVGLWLAGRVLLWIDAGLLAVLVDLFYLPVLCGVLAVPLVRSGNIRNLFVVGLLLALTLMNFIFHLRNVGAFVPTFIPSPLTSAVELVVLLVAVIGGRVIPGFIDRGVAGTPYEGKVAERVRAVEVGAIASLVALLAVDMVFPPWEASLLRGTIAGIAAVLHLVRLILWRPIRTQGMPLLWCLPLAYLWMPVGLVTITASTLGFLPLGTAMHALTVGLLAGMMLAMMTRSALGHTGRPLRASVWESLIFQAIFGAALFRFLWGVPGAFAVDIAFAGGLWIAAFGIFFLRYLPFLTRPRVDS